MINNKKSYCFALKTENNINLYLTKKHKPRYFTNAFAKSKASREKLNKVEANSTPVYNRAFFVRNFRTPKENRLAVNQSMMACSGQSLRLASFPLLLVSHPAIRYRQAVRSLAIAFNQFSKGLSAMIYKFLLLGTRLHVSTYANSEAKARQFLNLPRDKAIFIARIKGGNYA